MWKRKKMKTKKNNRESRRDKKKQLQRRKRKNLSQFRKKKSLNKRKKMMRKRVISCYLIQAMDPKLRLITGLRHWKK